MPYPGMITEAYCDESPRARLGTAESTDDGSSSVHPPQVRYTVVSAKRWSSAADRVSAALNTSSDTLKSLFGAAPGFSLSIQLLDEDAFYRESGAPAWTNAMYLEGKILIPVVEPVDEESLDNIIRSVRHEYTHAYVNAIAGGRCPGWVDEGLAQWFEGSVNPMLEEILARYMKSGSLIPIAQLQGGFTRLDNRIVGAAYGQSLFAVNSLLRSFHAPAMQRYFKLLKDGRSAVEAFKSSFGMSEREFESRLADAINAWAVRYHEKQASKDGGTPQVSMYQQMR